MADKGIIFSAAMVRALLDGRKTQTRRLCAWANNPTSPALTYIVACDEPGWFGDEEGEVQFKVPYAVGDRLYVREAWSVRGQFTDVVEVGYRASERRGHTEYVEQWPVAQAVPGKGKWPAWPNYGPSIHMPRWASRLWLTVTDIRVQRLQECSEGDAMAEGVPEALEDGDDDELYCQTCKGVGTHGALGHGLGVIEVDCRDCATAVQRYANLWNSLHTAEGERWQDNPWVVAVSFDVHQGNIDATST